MGALWSLQALLLLALEIAAFAVQAFAFVDALRQRADAFTAAGKLTKRLWLLITGISLVVGVIFLITQLGFPSSMGVFNPINIVALVAAGVYLADVRPAIRAITGGGGGNAGPYGGW